eukprot:1339622-Amorphochlora_amoeboformis.AAC.1
MPRRNMARGRCIWRARKAISRSDIGWANPNLNPKVVKTLIDSGAHINKGDIFGFTPLIWATKEQKVFYVGAVRVGVRVCLGLYRAKVGLGLWVRVTGLELG